MACCVRGALPPSYLVRPCPQRSPIPCPPCRDDLLPQGLDVNPALESYPDFVRDLPSPVRRRKGEAGVHWHATPLARPGACLAHTCVRVRPSATRLGACFVHTSALVPPCAISSVPCPCAQEPCFVLEVVKQEAGKPLSVHFT